MDAEALLAASSIYARFILGGVFLWAGIAKLRQSAAFQQAVEGFGLLPRQAAPVVARVIPPIEMGLGTLLVLGSETRWVAVATLLLLGTFSLAVSVALIRGHRGNCSCFGGDGAEMGWWIVERNVGLMLLGCGVAVSQPSVIGLDGLLFRNHASTFRLDQSLTAAAFLSIAIVIWLLIGESLKYRRHTYRVARKGA